MSQYAIAITIVAAAVLLATRWAWRNLKRAQQGNIKCAGCPLAEQCNSKKRQKPACGEIKSKKKTENLAG